MSGWKREDVIGCCGVIVSIVGVIVSIVGIIVSVANPEEVRRFFRLDDRPNSSIKQNQKDDPPKPLPPTLDRDTNSDPDLISKSTRVDYNPLRNLLAEGKWKEANSETARTMLQAADRGKAWDNAWWLRTKDIYNFSCEDLLIIDRLWLKFSGDRFGFSVQKEIYEELGGTREYNKEVFQNFGDRIGWWKKGENWLDYDELTFNLDEAPMAHLPVPPAFQMYYTKDFSFFGDSHPHLAGLFLFSRAKTCNL